MILSFIFEQVTHIKVTSVAINNRKQHIRKFCLDVNKNKILLPNNTISILNRIIIVVAF